MANHESFTRELCYSATFRERSWFPPGTARFPSIMILLAVAEVKYS